MRIDLSSQEQAALRVAFEPLVGLVEPAHHVDVVVQLARAMQAGTGARHA